MCVYVCVTHALLCVNVSSIDNDLGAGEPVHQVLCRNVFDRHWCHQHADLRKLPCRIVHLDARVHLLHAVRGWVLWRDHRRDLFPGRVLAVSHGHLLVAGPGSVLLVVRFRKVKYRMKALPSASVLLC